MNKVHKPYIIMYNVYKGNNKKHSNPVYPFCARCMLKVTTHSDITRFTHTKFTSKNQKAI